MLFLVDRAEYALFFYNLIRRKNMPVSEEQIENLMMSDMYQNANNPLHDDVNNFVTDWFKESTRNDFEKNALEQKAPTPAPTISDDELIERNIAKIQEHENTKNFAYKDSKGFVTVGDGLNVSDPILYHSLDWRRADGTKATPEEIEQDRQNILSAPVGNYDANTYRKDTSLRLSNAEIHGQTVAHLRTDLAQIRANIPNFDNLPPELQRVIMDIQYNTGHIEKFPLFQQAIRDKNVRVMIEESHRRDVSRDRNKSMAQEILRITNWDY